MRSLLDTNVVSELRKRDRADPGLRQWCAVGISSAPGEADPPVIVEPDAPLAGAIAAQLLESIPGWDAEVLQPYGRVEHAQFAEPDTLDIDETDQIVITVRISS